MRKFIIIFSIFWLTTGCHNEKINEEKKQYDEFISELKNANNEVFTNKLPFDINIYINKVISQEITYRVIIDNPKEEIHNIKAIVIHNFKTDNIFPTSGLFEKPLNLIPGNIDKEKGNVKGIILVGYIPFAKDINNFHGEFKVLVTYQDSHTNLNKIFYQYEK